ncbi:hypothetical protein DEA06_16080, partial [Microbacterium sp. Gd 4-13]|uniref:PDDEXK nuclease domain-containing protein n=1 Tax=Microbacterium sp. Gd 4-13 TaxID=2173179 RepID=UPI000D578755
GQAVVLCSRDVQAAIGIIRESEESALFRGLHNVDLLFFHVEQLRYVVIELKTTKFDPRDAGQLGFYVAVVDDQLRIREKHQPTVGILLVAGKNDTVVRYALASTSQPVAVSRYELTEDAQKALPDEAAITRAFADELARDVAEDDAGA